MPHDGQFLPQPLKAPLECPEDDLAYAMGQGCHSLWMAAAEQALAS